MSATLCHSHHHDTVVPLQQHLNVTHSVTMHHLHPLPHLTTLSWLDIDTEPSPPYQQHPTTFFASTLHTLDGALNTGQDNSRMHTTATIFTIPRYRLRPFPQLQRCTLLMAPLIRVRSIQECISTSSLRSNSYTYSLALAPLQRHLHTLDGALNTGQDNSKNACGSTTSQTSPPSLDLVCRSSAFA